MKPGKVIVANIHNPISIDIGSYAKHIHRPYLLGNTFIIGKDGTREEVIAKFEQWFDNQLQYNSSIRRCMYLYTDLLLAGKNLTLVCYCAPLPCHGDIIKNRLERLLEERMKGTNV